MRSLFLPFLLVALCGCHVEAEHTGKRPLGRRRAPDYENAPTIDQRLQARDRAPNAGGAETGIGGRAIDPDDQVVGAHGTSIYHVAGCDLLEGIGRPEQVLFVSPYDALDGGYKPCPRCRPGP